jgi:hypothetical protein
MGRPRKKKSDGRKEFLQSERIFGRMRREEKFKKKSALPIVRKGSCVSVLNNGKLFLFDRYRTMRIDEEGRSRQSGEFMLKYFCVFFFSM